MNEDIAFRRLRTQGLIGRRSTSPAEVVEWLGAVQSQDFGPAKWSVAMRMKGVDDAGMDRAFDDGEILRTHVLRPTWHFVSSRDIGWLLDLTGPRVLARHAGRLRQLGLDEATLKRSEKTITRALRGGNHMTRRELEPVLNKAGVDTDGQRLAWIATVCECRSLICSGRLKGKQQTYALLEERVRDSRTLDRDEALAELTRRFFTGHGPATAKDFGQWSSLPLADIRLGLDSVADGLEKDEIDGLTYWFGDRPPRRMPKSPHVLLLQRYDEYVAGYRESRRALDVAGLGNTHPALASFVGIVIVDSQLAGHWNRTFANDSMTLHVSPLVPFGDDTKRALQRAAREHARYLGAARVNVVQS